MAYFPFFIDLDQKPGLVVGGGPVAARKVRTLLPYSPCLTVCAPALVPELEVLSSLTLRREPFSPALLAGMSFVIAATDDRELNSYIARLCREQKIPVNVADPGMESTFLFPSVIQRGPLTVGISTGGKSPSAAHYLKEQIEGLLPGNLEDILLWMDTVRKELKGSPLPQPQRSACLSHLFAAALQAGGPLSQEEVQTLLRLEKEELS